MVVSQTRATLEFIAALIIAALASVIAHGYLFLGTDSDLLLSGISAVVMLFIVVGIFGLRNTAVTRHVIAKRYDRRFSMNEVAFMLRHTEGKRAGHGVVTAAAHPEGLWLSEPLSAKWALRRVKDNAELTV